MAGNSDGQNKSKVDNKPLKKPEHKETEQGDDGLDSSMEHFSE